MPIEMREDLVATQSGTVAARRGWGEWMGEMQVCAGWSGIVSSSEGQDTAGSLAPACSSRLRNLTTCGLGTPNWEASTSIVGGPVSALSSLHPLHIHAHG